MLENVFNDVRRRVQTLPLGATDSLRQRVWRGTAWTLFGYGAGQVMRLGGNLIVTRLLYPELFGLMALVTATTIGFLLLSDLGIGTSIVQNPRGKEPAFLNTAWTLQVGRGILLFLLSFPIANLIAQWYAEPRLRVLIPAASLGVLFAGFNATSLPTLQRELRIATLTKIELTAQASGIVAMILWAWVAPSMWALVCAAPVYALVRLIASHLVRAEIRNRFAWDHSSWRAIWSFGKWVLLTSSILFFAEQSDRLMLGKVAPLELLGVYGIALTFAEIPRQITLAVAGNVLFPALSSLQNLPRPALRAKIVKNRVPILYALAAFVVCFAALGDFLVRLLYDARYWQATWMLPLLALGMWPRMLCNTIEPALYAIGKPQYTAAAQATRVVWTVGGVLIGFAAAGIFGAVLAIALNDIVYYAVINFGLRREGLSALRQDARATALLLAILCLMIVTRYLTGWGLS